MKLSVFRKQIDELDERIVRLLSRRAEVVGRIGELKRRQAADVYVPAREKAVLDHVRSVNRGPLGDAALVAIYREIMSASLALERQVRIAYLGPPSTFTHQAARGRFGASVEYVPCETIADVFAVVEKGVADHGVVPIENSTEGAVTHTFDMFMETPLKICAEINLRISMNLMATGPQARIRRIASKAEAFGQCRGFLRAELPGVELLPVTSTARAAEMAARDPRTAALAGALAAEMYGLRILVPDVQDLSGNMTRFLVIGPRAGDPTGEDKTSILFALKHRAGALHDALTSFKKYKLSLTMIESRPSRRKAWEYCFFADMEGHVGEPRVARALRDLERHCMFMTVLGAYPRAPGPEA